MATNRGLSYQLSKEVMCRSSKGKLFRYSDNPIYNTDIDEKYFD